MRLPAEGHQLSLKPGDEVVEKGVGGNSGGGIRTNAFNKSRS